MAEGDLGASSPLIPYVFESGSIYHTPPYRDTSMSQISEGLFYDELMTD
jgi:hypothetical protein